jgi:hypothetical protein
MSAASQEVLRENNEHGRLLTKIEHILTDPDLLAAARRDSIATFEKLGLTNDRAAQLFDSIVRQFTSADGSRQTLEQIEESIFDEFQAIHIGDSTLIECLDAALSSRASLIASQVAPHLKVGEGTFDMGTGDGGVSYALQERGMRIDGAVDVIDYRKPHPAHQEELPFNLYDGETLPFDDDAFEQSMMTNVAHHAGETDDGQGGRKTNEPMLSELCRVTNNRIVVIETIPDPAVIESEGLPIAHERTRWNDYLYNRLFHARVNGGVRTNIPVPGRYETAEGWVERFRKLGWKAVRTEHLGYDQDAIQDYHILYVFEPDPEFQAPERVAAETREAAPVVHALKAA